MFLVGDYLLPSVHVHQRRFWFYTFAISQVQAVEIGQVGQTVDVLESIATTQVQTGEISQIGQAVDILEINASTHIQAGELGQVG